MMMTIVFEGQVLYNILPKPEHKMLCLFWLIFFVIYSS
jgi:hypothetical protein